MHDSAKAWRKVPPQYSPLAFSMKRPPTLMPSLISNSSVELDDALFKRRDRGEDLEGRARGLGGGEGLAGECADVAGLGVEDGDAARPPGQRRDRGFLQRRVDRRPHRGARLPASIRRARGRPSFRRIRPDSAALLPFDFVSAAGTASSLPPGLPARRRLKARSRPLIPTGVSGGKPWRGEARLVFFGGFADFPGDVDRGACPSGVRVRSPGLRRATVPSAARIDARGASSVCASSFSPGFRPGKTR